MHESEDDRVPPSIESARFEWLAAQYERATTLLVSMPPSAEREILLARILLRRNRLTESLEIIQRSFVDGLFDDSISRDRGRALEAQIFAALGRPQDARAALDALSRNVRDTRSLAELRCDEALTLWLLHDNEAALSIVNEYLSRHTNIDLNVTGRFEMLRSWLFAADERYMDQAVFLVKAIEHIQSAATPDIGLSASACQALAALVRELHFPRGISTITRIESSLPWTQELHTCRFYTVRSIAWFHALNGDYIEAYRTLNRAKLFANTPETQLASHLDSACVARISHQELIVRAELADAQELVDSHDWSAPTWDEPVLFTYAAEQFAYVDWQRADIFLNTAMKLRHLVTQNSGLTHDRRFAAMLDYSEALVRKARGELRVARHRAERAFATFSTIGYTWRAALCSLLLHEVTQDTGWLEKATALAKPYPRSFFAVETESRQNAPNPLLHLTRRQREVAELLYDGKQTDQAAACLGISPDTVRQHIGKIYRTIGARNRSQFLQKYRLFRAS